MISKSYTIWMLVIAVLLTLVALVTGLSTTFWTTHISLIVLTHAFTVFMIFRFRRAILATKHLNETMETRVNEQTIELLWNNSELQKSERNNKALLNAMPDSKWRTDRDGFFLDYIPATGEVSIIPAEGWKGKTVFDVLPSQIAKRMIKLADLALRSEEAQIFDFHLNNGDKLQHYDCRVTACGDAETLTIVRDITEIKQSEAGAQVIFEIIQGISTTSNLNELLDYIYHSIGKFLYAENYYVALYNSSSGNFDLPIFIDKFNTASSSIEIDRGLTSYVYRTGQPMLLTLDNITQLVEDGEVELNGPPPATWLGVPLRTPTGVIGVLAVHHYEDESVYDICDLDLLTSVGDQIAVAIERKRSDKALRASDARFQCAFDYAPIGIGLVSLDGRWEKANRALCEIVGYTEKELLQTTLIEITQNDESDTVEKSFQQIVNGNTKTCQFETRYVHKVGHQLLVSISLSLVRDSENEPICVIAQIQDLTERRIMEEKLHRGQKLESIGQLASGIAHEINTPTQYVGDNVRFLKDSFETITSVLEKNGKLLELCRTNKVFPEFVADLDKSIVSADISYIFEEVPMAFDQALSGVKRISKIVQSMNDFAHPGSCEMQATDLNRAIESTITVASNEWKYVADVVTQYDEELPPVQCYAGEFNQVVLNMIVNAANAISETIVNGDGEKGTIRISTKLNGDFAEIRISDTGVGMPDRIRKKIFDPFFTTKEVGKGSGQGLAVSHNVIVEKHKGTIDVESKVGVGTRFTLCLPLS